MARLLSGSPQKFPPHIPAQKQWNEESRSPPTADREARKPPAEATARDRGYLDYPPSELLKNTQRKADAPCSPGKTPAEPLEARGSGVSPD